MACEIISVEGAVFVLWGKPTKPDMDRVADRVELIAKASKRPILYITRVPTAAPPPEPEVRSYMNANMPRMIKVCSSYHVLLEGSGFVSALKRAILASILQLGWRNRTFFVHENEKSIFAKVDRDVRPDLEAILQLAQSRGLLTAPAPDDVPLPNARTAGRLAPVERSLTH